LGLEIVVNRNSGKKRWLGDAEAFRQGEQSGRLVATRTGIYTVDKYGGIKSSPDTYEYVPSDTPDGVISDPQERAWIDYLRKKAGGK
jgi:hypothetical protein